MGKTTEKAVRIQEGVYTDWNKLIYDYPDIKPKKKDGQIYEVSLPNGAVNQTCVIFGNQVYTLEFYDSQNGNLHIRYTSPLARKSELYRLLDL